MKGTDETQNMNHPKYHDYQKYVEAKKNNQQNRNAKLDSDFYSNKEKYYDIEDNMYHMTKAQLNTIIDYYVKNEKHTQKTVIKIYKKIVMVLGTIEFWLLALTGMTTLIKVLIGIN